MDQKFIIDRVEMYLFCCSGCPVNSFKDSFGHWVLQNFELQYHNWPLGKTGNEIGHYHSGQVLNARLMLQTHSSPTGLPGSSLSHLEQHGPTNTSAFLIIGWFCHRILRKSVNLKLHRVSLYYKHECFKQNAYTVLKTSQSRQMAAPLESGSAQHQQQDEFWKMSSLASKWDLKNAFSQTKKHTLAKEPVVRGIYVKIANELWHLVWIKEALNSQNIGSLDFWNGIKVYWKKMK